MNKVRRWATIALVLGTAAAFQPLVSVSASGDANESAPDHRAARLQCPRGVEAITVVAEYDLADADLAGSDSSDAAFELLLDRSFPGARRADFDRRATAATEHVFEMATASFRAMEVDVIGSSDSTWLMQDLVVCESQARQWLQAGDGR